MTHFKKYWLWYTIAVVILIALLVYFNWETVKGWFSSSQGRYASSDTNASTRQACIDVGGGDCSYHGMLVPCVECTKRGIVIK